MNLGVKLMTGKFDFSHFPFFFFLTKSLKKFVVLVDICMLG